MAPHDAVDPPIGLQNRLYLLLENPGKPNNLGSILRCASAFGIRTIVAIGSDKCSVEGEIPHIFLAVREDGNVHSPLTHVHLFPQVHTELPNMLTF